MTSACPRRPCHQLSHRSYFSIPHCVDSIFGCFWIILHYFFQIDFLYSDRMAKFLPGQSECRGSWPVIIGRGNEIWPCPTKWPLPYYMIGTKITSLLKMSPTSCPSSNGQTILVEYINSEQCWNVAQKKIRINGTIWFSTCVVKKWPFCTRCEQNRHFGRYLSWYGVVNSDKTPLGDVALILLYLPKIFPISVR